MAPGLTPLLLQVAPGLTPLLLQVAPGLTPVLLYNGVLHCQSGNGAVSSLTLPTHDAILQAPFSF